MSSNKKHKRKLLTSVLSTSFLLATLSPAFAADLNDVKDGSFRIGKDVYDAQSPDFTYDNVLQSLPPDNEQFYKFNSSWFNIPGLTQYDDLFNNEKAVSVNELKSWTDLDQYYKDSGTIDDFVFIKVESVSAINGKLTVDFAGLEEAPAAADFEITYVITTDDVAQEGMTVTATDEDITFADGDVTIAVPELPQTEVEQSVVYTVSYKDAAAVSAEAFVIEAQPVDEEAPVVTVEGLEDAATVNEAALSFTVAVTDNVDEAVAPVVKLGETVVEPVDGTYNVTLAEGANTITVEATDAAGNVTTQTYTVTYEVPVQTVAVDAVNTVAETSIEVKLALGVEETLAADVEYYAVTVGGEAVEVKEVSYSKARNVAVLTVDLKGLDGKVLVNGKESKEFDFKAPVVADVIPIAINQFKVVFNEELNTAAAEVYTNYSLVETGTANVIAIKDTVELLGDKKTVLVETDTNLTEGTSYTVGVKGVKDAKLNVIEKWINSQFVAIKDTDKPTIANAVSTDANKIVITMSEDVKLDSAKAILKIYDEDGNFVKDGDKDKTIELTLPELINGTELIFTIDGESNYLENGKQYNVTLTGVKDLSDNAIEANQQADFVGVRDVVAPTVAGTTYDSEKGTLKITFSEAMLIDADEVDSARVTNTANYVIVETNTGVSKGNPSKAVYDAKDNSVTLTLPAINPLNDSLLDYSTDYTVVLSGLKDAATVANPLKDKTKVFFKSVAEEVKATEVFKAESTGGTTVEVTFTEKVSEAEAEDVLNYSIVAVDDETKTLEITKAELSGKVVTLTTEKQDGAEYKVVVSNISNMVAGKNTDEFTSTDKVAPTLTDINVVNDRVVELVFSEKVVIEEGTTITVFDVEGVAPVEGFTRIVSDNKVRLTFDLVEGKSVLKSGNTYKVAVDKLNDTADDPYTKEVNEANTTEKLTGEFVAGSTDSTPASITGVTVLNAAKIVLQFNEELTTTEDEGALTTLAGKVTVEYQKDGAAKAVTVDSVEFDGTDKLVVNLDDAAENILDNGVKYTVKVTGELKDLVGNETTTASFEFDGYRDSVAPRLVSAKPAAKDDSKVILTFSEAIDSAGTKDDYVITNVDTYDEITVKSVVLGKASGIEGLENNSVVLTIEAGKTVAGEEYRVYVKGDIKDTAVAKNTIDKDYRLALFTGIDTTTPTISSVTLVGCGVVVAALDEENKATITVTVPSEDAFVTTGKLTIEEDIFVKMDAKEDKYDIVNAIPVSQAVAGELVDLILTIFSDNGTEGASTATLLNNDGTTITISDAAGNTAIYTLDIK